MKRMNLRSSFIVALLLALVLPILAACGGTAPATAPTAAEAPTAAAAPTAAEAPTAAAAPTAAEAPTAAPEAGGSGPDKDGYLRMAESVWPDQLDPQKSSFSNEIAVLILNYEGLTRFDKDLKTVPGAAEKWESNKDGTEWTFMLRDGLKYSDGSPLTSKDFAEAIYHSLDPHNPGDYQQTFFMIKGAEDIINTVVPTDEGKLTDLKGKLGIATPDDKTIKFTLTQPTPYFPTIAGIWVAYPTKKASFESSETWWEDATKQIGNGPFQITKIDKATNLMEFKANENYWGGKPKIAGVRYQYIEDLAVALQAYKNGEVDVMTPDANDVPTIQADAVLGKEFKSYAGACTLGWEFNLLRPPFDNAKVREAFAYAFDREAFIRDALKNTNVKTLTWIPPGYPGYDANETRFDLDLAKAKQALTDAGYPDGKGLPEIKLTYSSNNPANQQRAEYLVQMYKNNLGIDLTLDPVESTTLTAMRKDPKTFPQLVRGGWCADYPDQQDWLSIFWHSRTEFAKNISYKDPEADKLMDAADVELDPVKRADLYQQAQVKIIGGLPMIIYGNSKNQFLIKPWVKGLDFTPQDSDEPGLITGLMNVTLGQ
ncbi:MAG: peptide ABC transporter substrate-binding protein [Chloroflexi bacterium SZAS-1]|jgi:oligopeptide transport system substrate-binding protein|nr:peptide ABC transporter substrate-binding protein [Chloroflexi bacterium SZAS-1]HNP85926.1 peptide ABC transporter substrate-binding protein [Kouleothrix sp.]